MVHEGHFMLHILENPVSRYPFPLAVASKIAKHAVVRNKMKRRARVIVHELLGRKWQEKHGVIYAKKGAENLSYDELKIEFSALLKKAKIVS